MRLSEFQGLPNKDTAHAGPVTIGATATPLTSVVTLGAWTHFVLVRVETAPVRLTFDNASPTATRGFRIESGEQLLLSKAEAEHARLIRAESADAALQVAQFIS
jgi:hypothetical protein